MPFFANLFSKDQKLCRAIQNNKEKDRDFSLLIKQVKNLNSKDKKVNTPLHLAVSSIGASRLSQGSQAKLIAQLLQADADPNSKNQDGETPLHLAVSSISASLFPEGGQEKLIAQLLQAGAEPNSKNQDGKTPLYILISDRSFLSVKRTNIFQLLRAGADLNQPDHGGYTPIFQACLQGSAELTDFLIQQGAKINIVSRSGETPYSLVISQLESTDSHIRANDFTKTQQLLLQNDAQRHGSYWSTVDCGEKTIGSSPRP